MNRLVIPLVGEYDTFGVKWLSNVTQYIIINVISAPALAPSL